MKYLSIEWFKSKIENAVEKATEKIITKKIETLVETLSNTEVQESPPEGNEIVPETVQEPVSYGQIPYVTAIEVNGTLTVILNDGKVLVKQGVTLENLQSLRTEEEVVELMLSEEMDFIKENREHKRKCLEKMELLTATGDFEIRGDSIYMKGINRSLPELLLHSFVSSLEDSIRYQSLVRFWKKCALNPNAQSAEDLYAFLEKHHMKIDRHGNFYAYRRVRSISTENSKELVSFVSNAYHKVKAIWKKKPTEYRVVKIQETLVLEKIDSQLKGKILGNLESLYLDLPNMKENRYTSAHTGKEDYRVGNVISMPRYHGDDDNSRNCSKGFHAASKEYDYTGFGDQDILVIINPMDVLAVPTTEFGKLRTCRWFFAMTLDEGERYILDEDCFDVTYLGDVFEDKCLEDLEEHVKRGFTEEVKRHTFSLPEINHREIEKICKDLSKIKSELAQRVVKV